MRELSFLETNLEQTEEFGKCTSGGTRSSLCVLHLFLWADTVGPRWHPGWHTLCPRAGRRVGHGQKAGSPKGGILGVGAWVFMCVIGIFSFMLMEAWFYFTYRLWFRYGWVGKTRSYSFLESLVLFKPSLEVLLCAHTQKVSKGASRTNNCDGQNSDLTRDITHSSRHSHHSLGPPSSPCKAGTIAIRITGAAT